MGAPSSPRRSGGTPSWRRPGRRWPTAAWRPSDVVGLGCTSQWSGTVPVDDGGCGPRPGHHLDGLAGCPRRPRDGARCAQRAGLFGVEAGPLGAPHRRHPEPVGQGPGGPHPLPAPAAPRRLRGGRRLPRAGRLPQLAPHRVGPGLARLHHLALGDGQPRHRCDRLRRLPHGAGRTGAVEAARPGADGQRARGTDSRCGRRARPAPGHAGRGGHRGPALGCRRLGRRRRLRRPPLHRHLELDQLPRPLQEDRPADQHRLDPFGDPRAATSWPTSTRPAAPA